MNAPLMKSLLLRDKEFLRELYKCESASHSKTILNFASDSQLNTLIKFLYMVSNGHIKIKKENFSKLSTGHLKHFKKHLGSKAALQRLLSSERRTRLQYLYKFNGSYHDLLFTLFNQIMNN